MWLTNIETFSPMSLSLDLSHELLEHESMLSRTSTVKLHIPGAEKFTGPYSHGFWNYRCNLGHVCLKFWWHCMISVFPTILCALEGAHRAQYHKYWIYRKFQIIDIVISLFCGAITECLKLSTLWNVKKVYLVHSSGDLRVRLQVLPILVRVS